MPENIFAKAKKSHDLFKDERFLYPEFVPERLPHRDAEVDALVFSLQPVLQGKKPQNVFVYGKSGTGKTATVRFVLNELQQYSDRAKGLYINCFQFNTRHAILTQIANFLGAPTPRRGIGTDEAYSQLNAVLRKTGFVPVIVLDEADQLLHQGEADRLFYDLLRGGEQQRGAFGLIFISNQQEFTARLDARVRSSLGEQTVCFEQYTPQQLKDILKERVQYAFHSNALDADVINVAAAHAAKFGGDARIAIECLLKAGRQAEKENAEKVLVAHLRKVFPQIDAAVLQKSIGFLSADELAILRAVPANSQIASGDLYGAYAKSVKKPVTQRQFRTLRAKLERMRLINCEEAIKGAKGRTVMISLAFPKAKLEGTAGRESETIKKESRN
ncbi:MAG: AAA family ATPase [Candidatus Diapherotrites archaeon]|nr:AAA family ATPase [Candidatus Diapherotrites archaeon]